MTNLIKSTFICTRIQNYVSYLKNFVDYKFLNEINFSNVHFLDGFFNEKFWLIVRRWSVWRAVSTIMLKFWLKFCFLTITQMFLNEID